MTTDKLAEMYEQQMALMRQYDLPVPSETESWPPHTITEMTLRMTRALSHEAHELEDWLPWKHWSQQPGNKADIKMWSPEHYREMHLEIIDSWHFYLEMMIFNRWTPTMIRDEYTRWVTLEFGFDPDHLANSPNDKLELLLFIEEFTQKRMGMRMGELRPDYLVVDTGICRRMMSQAVGQLEAVLNWHLHFGLAEDLDARVSGIDQPFCFSRILHTLLLTTLVHGLTADKVFELYCHKNMVNQQRQASGEY